MRTTTYTSLDAVASPHGTNLDRVQIDTHGHVTTTFVHPTKDTVSRWWMHEDGLDGHVTVTLEAEWHTAVHVCFSPDEIEQLEALRDSCTKALRKLRQMKGA